jgi:putative nucleotidyltransferase with HDIG domain
VASPVRSYVRSLGLDAYVVGGSVRDEILGIPHEDEDFLVPGVDQQGLLDLLRPHGRVEEIEVHGRVVGVRLHPADPSVRALAPKGIELTPPRAERSTGPGHRDFEIVAGADITIADDMARRDFTVNAMACSLADGSLVDPFGGRADLDARVLRTVSETSFSEDPLRILRGLRLVSQLGFTLAPETVEQMRLAAPGLEHVSGERIGGGLAADGRGELSKLLLGRDPLTALRIARDTGALTAFLPEIEPTIGYDLRSARQPMSLDEHLFAVVEAAATADASLAVRLAALLHDLGKPEADRDGGSHVEAGTRMSRAVLARLRYPNALARRVRAIVAGHAFSTDPWAGDDDGGRATRRFLARHGEALARDLIVHKRADLSTKDVSEAERHALERLSRELDTQASNPHRIADLAVGGRDLIDLGLTEGPLLGELLRALLERVVDDPSLNTREALVDLVGELRS